jgi:hypothetical protein
MIVRTGHSDHTQLQLNLTLHTFNGEWRPRYHFSPISSHPLEIVCKEVTACSERTAIPVDRDTDARDEG